MFGERLCFFPQRLYSILRFFRLTPKKFERTGNRRNSRHDPEGETRTHRHRAEETGDGPQPGPHTQLHRCHARQAPCQRPDPPGCPWGRRTNRIDSFRLSGEPDEQILAPRSGERSRHTLLVQHPHQPLVERPSGLPASLRGLRRGEEPPQHGLLDIGLVTGKLRAE